MFVLYDDVQMDPINSQEYNSFEIYAVTHQDIYDWISSINKRSGSPFILTQQSMGRTE